MIKNKKAWIRIVEAFVAILLVMGVLLIVLNKGYIGKKDISAEIYKVEISILREVQLNDALRDDILNIETPPIEWENFEDEGLSNLKNKIISRLPNYLDCEAKICAINKTCVLDKVFDEDVYAQSVSITAGLTEFNPRQLKLFCWIGTPPEPEESELCGNGICEEDETNANCPLDCYCGDGICWNDETYIACPEDCEEPPLQTCVELGGTCQINPCDTYSDCILLEEICETIVVETGCVWNFDDECDEWSGGGTLTDEDCDLFEEAYECYDEQCISLKGSCGSEYCCDGACTQKTCAELEGDICTAEETCEEPYLEASDTEACCPEECENQRAILTLVFSDTVYELQTNVNIGGTVYPEVHYYYHTRTFTESNNVGVTLTSGQICYSQPSPNCDPVGVVNYRIDENSDLIHFDKRFLTTRDSQIFTLTYWGTDDNGYAVTVTQNLCVQETSFTENCVI